MKIFIISFFILIITLSISCNKDKADAYSLVNISGGFAGESDDFPKGELTWSFIGDKLIAKNKQNTTVHDYKFFTVSNNLKLKIDSNQEYYVSVFNNDSLYLFDGNGCGYSYLYIK
jgi:hypothetical protein